MNNDQGTDMNMMNNQGGNPNMNQMPPNPNMNGQMNNMPAPDMNNQMNNMAPQMGQPAFNNGMDPNMNQMPPNPNMNQMPPNPNMNQMPPNPNMNQMPQEPKKNNKMFIIIVAVLAVVIVVVLFLVLGKKNESTPTPTPNPDNGGGSQTPTPTADTIDFQGYTFVIPDDYSAQEESGVLLLQKTSVVVMIDVKTSTDYNTLKTKMIDGKSSFESQGIVVDNGTEKTIGSRKWYVMNGTLAYNGSTLLCNVSGTQFQNGSLYIVAYTTASSLDEAYSVVNTFLDSAKKSNSSFAPTTDDSNDFKAITGNKPVLSE